jgi:hypothetical protein
MGGAADSSSCVLASSDTSGHVLNSACLLASFMAKAKQVGTPHLPQLVFGSNL